MSCYGRQSACACVCLLLAKLHAFYIQSELSKYTLALLTCGERVADLHQQQAVDWKQVITEFIPYFKCVHY